MRPSARAFLVLAALSLATGGCRAAPEEAPPQELAQEKAALGLFGTLPIYWGEAADISESLAGEAEQGWVRGALEKGYRLEPLDTVDAEELSGLRYLFLAQPRALSGSENVALDAWVRAGGKLLLFADPMLTGHSRFAVGDRRRPQDVILLSPILNHWGLSLEFDDEAPEGEQTFDWEGRAFPVNLPGQLVTAKGAPCIVTASIVATCRIGKGQVVVVSDAALLEDAGNSPEREKLLAALTTRAFD